MHVLRIHSYSSAYIRVYIRVSSYLVINASSSVDLVWPIGSVVPKTEAYTTE
jgi:hypothetical protein